MKRMVKFFSVILLVAAMITVPMSTPFMQYKTVQAATVVGLNKTKITVYVGEKDSLELEGTKNDINWTSSNKKIATVSLSGKVLGVKKGTTIITAQVGAKKYKCNVTVKNHSINKQSLKMIIGDKENLSIIGATGKVTWKSSDTSVVTVNSSGKVLAKAVGNTEITAKYLNKTYTCKITVNDGKLTAEEVYNACSPSTVQINTNLGLGSGFFIEENKVVTNFHVIDGATSINIQLQNGKKYDIDSILGYSKELDLAILSVSVKNTPLTINTHDVKNGETVYAIGSSQGYTDTFTNGIVTNHSRVIDNVEFIQTNAAITNGNSGGPLINAYGEVIGINTMQNIEGQNLNFAINIKQIKSINTSNPLTAAEYYKANVTEESNDDDVIQEDTTKSGDSFTCQTLNSKDYVEGTLKVDDLDWYQFTLTSESLIGILSAPNTNYDSDMERMKVTLVDTNKNIIDEAWIEVLEGAFYLTIYDKLPAGTYYIKVYSNPEANYAEMPYGLMFGILNN